MSIKKCCENCVLEYLPYDDNCIGCKFWYEDKKTGKDLFIPKERLIRQDERNKIVDILGMDLEDAKKVLVETIKKIDKEQLYKDLVLCGLLVEKENKDD